MSFADGVAGWQKSGDITKKVLSKEQEQAAFVAARAKEDAKRGAKKALRAKVKGFLTNSAVALSLASLDMADSFDKKRKRALKIELEDQATQSQQDARKVLWAKRDEVAQAAYLAAQNAPHPEETKAAGARAAGKKPAKKGR